MKNNENIHSMRAETRNTRVFTCGCRQKTVVDVVFSKNGRPYCAVHNQPIEGYLVVCEMCGEEVLRNTRAAKSKYCPDCCDRKYKRGKYRQDRKRINREISKQDKEYIQAHPWQTSTEISRVIGLHRKTVSKYKNKCKMPKVEGPLNRYWREKRLDQWAVA